MSSKYSVPLTERTYKYLINFLETTPRPLVEDILNKNITMNVTAGSSSHVPEDINNFNMMDTSEPMESNEPENVVVERMETGQGLSIEDITVNVMVMPDGTVLLNQSDDDGTDGTFQQMRPSTSTSPATDRPVTPPSAVVKDLVDHKSVYMKDPTTGRQLTSADLSVTREAGMIPVVACEHKDFVTVFGEKALKEVNEKNVADHVNYFPPPHSLIERFLVSPADIQDIRERDVVPFGTFNFDD